MRSLINENSDPFVTTKDITGQFVANTRRTQGLDHEFTDRDSVCPDRDDAGLLKDDFPMFPIQRTYRNSE